MTEQRSGDGWWVTSFVIGIVALIVGVIGIALAAGDNESRSAAAAGGGTGGQTEFDVTLADISVSPRSIDVPEGQVVTLHVTNTGVMDHDLKVNGESGTRMLKPGESETIVVGPFSAATSAWCTVPGHRAAGMEMAINVVGGTPAGPAHEGSSAGGSSGGSGAGFATI
ncbi:MAG TPA: hypothetical protein DCR14_03860, partial [Acidimicrobiaceae bacterium]|nr:hypothetical protein [Acidimicrobiaceae bacterium]